MSKPVEIGRLAADAVREIPATVARSMDRFSTDLLTQKHLTTPASRLREAPVSGDVLAFYRVTARRGATDET